MGKNTKIDWCDATWNPVTGCLHGCEYCYARRIAERFGSKQTPIFTDHPVLTEPVRDSAGKSNPYPFDFTPTFHRYRLDEPQKWKKPRNIFVCSMADLFGEWVPDQWIADVFDACAKAPQHRYLFLTKNPKRYKDICLIDALPYGPGYWYGTTVTKAWDGAFLVKQEKRFYNTFVSIEPIQERFGQHSPNRSCIELTDWVIIGAETGNRHGKIIPEKGWIDEIVEACDTYRKPVFMKESLREMMGGDFRQEFPWGRDCMADMEKALSGTGSGWISGGYNDRCWKFRCPYCGSIVYWPQITRAKPLSGKTCPYPMCPWCGKRMDGGDADE